MVDGRQLKKAIDKFMQSPVCLDARVQIELPNGEMYDLTTMTLLENRLLGSSETHRLVLRCSEPKIKMGKIISTSNYDIPYYISDNSYVSKTYKWKPLKTIYNVVYDTYIWILKTLN